MRRLLMIAFFFDVGFVLMLVPWSNFWDRNYFAEAVPMVHAFVTNNFVRGAVSGIGLVNVVTGFSELVSLFLMRQSEDATISIRHPATEE